MALKEALTGCEHIFLGNMAKRPDTVHQMTGATGIFYLSEQDVLNLNTLKAEGFSISFQQLPTASETDWDAFVKSL